MNTTKKLLVLVLAVAIAVVCFVPSTFSWYSHNSAKDGNENYIPNGNLISYQNPTLPVSMKTLEDGTNNSVAIESTVIADKHGKPNSADTTDYSGSTKTINANTVSYYKTTLKNYGSDDVIIDLNAFGLSNSSDVKVGTILPTLNEKSYASRAVRTKATGTTFRVYFKSNQGFYPYWTKYDNSASITYNASLANDMNVMYKQPGGNETPLRLTICPDTKGTNNAYLNALVANNNENNVKTAINNAIFYADIPADVEYFFFFNHYYYKTTENRNWNSTIHITDKTQGKLYTMTGGVSGDEHKEYSASAADTDLVAVNSYYKTVSMSAGSSSNADISLKKTSDVDPEFVPEYYGTSIKYEIDTTTTNAAGITVNLDGYITGGNSYGTSRIKTTIKGKWGDELSLYTDVVVQQSIDQVPIMKNILVPKKGTDNKPDGTPGNEVTVDWYVANYGGSNAQIGALFFTV